MEEICQKYNKEMSNVCTKACHKYRLCVCVCVCARVCVRACVCLCVWGVGVFVRV